MSSRLCSRIDRCCLFQTDFSLRLELLNLTGHDMTSMNMFLSGVRVMSVDQCCLVSDRHCPYIPRSIPTTGHDLCSTLNCQASDRLQCFHVQSIKQLEPAGQSSLVPRIVRILFSVSLSFCLSRPICLAFSLFLAPSLSPTVTLTL